MMKHLLFIFFAIAHLGLILYNNIVIEEQCLNQYFYDKKEPGTALRLLAHIPYCLEAFDCYSKYTGAETGYGLYAPNVSSDIVIMLTSIDSGGRIITIAAPQLSSREACMRFSSAAGMFMEKTGKPDKTRDQYLNVVLKSIALWTKQQKPGCKKVLADLLVYNLPTPAQIKLEQHPSYIKLGHYEYTF